MAAFSSLSCLLVLICPISSLSVASSMAWYSAFCRICMQWELWEKSSQIRRLAGKTPVLQRWCEFTSFSFWNRERHSTLAKLEEMHMSSGSTGLKLAKSNTMKGKREKTWKREEGWEKGIRSCAMTSNTSSPGFSLGLMLLFASHYIFSFIKAISYKGENWKLVSHPVLSLKIDKIVL